MNEDQSEESESKKQPMINEKVEQETKKSSDDAIVSESDKSNDELVNTEEEKNKKVHWSEQNIQIHKAKFKSKYILYFISGTILLFVFILIMMIHYRSSRAVVQGKYLDVLEVVENKRGLTESDIALQKERFEARIENLQNKLSQSAISKLDSVLAKSDISVKQLFTEVLKDENINSEIEEFYRSSLGKTIIGDDEYLRVVRQGVNRDISISNEEVSSLLYYMVKKGSSASKRFELMDSKNDTYLIDTHEGNIWIEKEGKFTKVNIPGIELAIDESEMKNVVRAIINSTRGTVIDYRK